jgi:ribonucleoside-diphosphate reductase alpha chain
MTEINVVKRNNTTEPLDLDKIHRVVNAACSGLNDVSESLIEINANLQFYNGIKTTNIHETIIKSARNLISEDSPNYQIVAGRLINYALRKEVFGGVKIPSLKEHLDSVKSADVYDQDLYNLYSEEELIAIDKFIWHDRDYDLVYGAMEQFRTKYLIRNRITHTIYETPQIAYILISMSFFMYESDKKLRLKLIKEFYDAISQHYISLPTPIMAGLRSPDKQFSSCTLIECGDSLESIGSTTQAILKYVSNRAGIGIGAGAIRAFNSSIRNGRAYHTGVMPFYRLFESAVGSCSQGSVRKGSATLNYCFWHYELEDILVLKNNKGTPDSRVRGLDYCIHLNKLFYQRFIDGKDITLFSPSEVPGLYEAFYKNDLEFEMLYTKYEADPSIRKKIIKSIDLFNSLAIERKDTGRIYIMNVDHANSHSSFDPNVNPIRMTNLCVEITLPTKPMTNDGGQIALCTLGAINWGKIRNPNEFEKYTRLIVRALDNLLDFQTYPMHQAEENTKVFRPLGVGLINFAYFLTKNGVKWGSPAALKLTHEYSEAFSYYMIKASNELAKERGKVATDGIKYNEGILPIDHYKKTVDELIVPEYKCDWNDLREKLIAHGIRNSTLMALMPSETSSVISNATNGVEPPRSFVTTKTSKDSTLCQVLPELKKYKNKYELLWDMPSPKPYLETLAVINKFIDQSISTNTSYNPVHYPDGKIPISVLIGDILYAYKLGLKTLYYNNTNDESTSIKEETTVASANNSDIIEEDCEGCKL